MSGAIVKRRVGLGRRRARRNPLGSDLAWGLGWNVAAGVLGYAYGSTQPTPGGAMVNSNIMTAVGSIALVDVIGLGVGIFSKKHRSVGFTTTGIGVGAGVLLVAISKLRSATAPPLTTP